MGLASRKPLSYAGSEHPLWTHSMHDDGRKILEVWCENIPGLVRTGTCSWALQGKTEISYPRGGHASIADIEESSFWFKHRNAVIAAVVRRFRPLAPSSISAAATAMSASACAEQVSIALLSNPDRSALTMLWAAV